MKVKTFKISRNWGLGLVLLCALQWIFQFGTSFHHGDYSSRGKGRTAVMGKAVPTKQKLKEEVKVIMNDPAISAAWGLKMTDVQQAWRISQGSRKIVVAVIDTGCDTHHPDLVHNLWINPGETGKDKYGRDKATNHIDDDGNGYVDDVHGWNFVDNNNDLSDHQGHGTHIAGIIGAEGGNGIGISGVSPKVSLMILRYYASNDKAMYNLVNTVKAINYAVDMHANIINYSGGGTSPSPQEKAAITRAMKAGILFVAAAGNERSDSDFHKYYPADYGLPNILSVTAIDRYKNVLPSSNYGTDTVDIAAPGNNILSTLPGGEYGYMTGTSQATAFATGVAALVMANNPNLRKAEEIKKYLTQTGDTDDRLIGKTRYRTRLNSYRALAIQDSDLDFNGARADNSAAFHPHEFASDAPALPTSNSMTNFAKQIRLHLGVQTARVRTEKLN